MFSDTHSSLFLLDVVGWDQFVTSNIHTHVSLYTCIYTFTYTHTVHLYYISLPYYDKQLITKICGLEVYFCWFVIIFHFLLACSVLVCCSSVSLSPIFQPQQHTHTHTKCLRHWHPKHRVLLLATMLAPIDWDLCNDIPLYRYQILKSIFNGN